MNIPQLVGEIIITFFTTIGAALPQFLAGLVLLIIGLIMAAVLKGVLLGFFRLVNVRSLLKSVKAAQALDVDAWEKLVAELARWSILILFLVGAVEAWGLTRVSELLNQLLVYLPNVFVAVVMGFVGFVVANLVQDVVLHGAKGLSSKSARRLSAFARYAVLVFTGLLLLHQLGVAADLIRILFTGIVAMLAISGGIAFGLGGKDTAKKVLEDLYKETKE